MTDLQQWAQRWGLPPLALTELANILAATPSPEHTGSVASEGAAQTSIRLAAPRFGVMLWRNNVGMLPDREGRPVRFGLANDSKRVNKKTKSSDLVGIMPLQIAPHHIGRTLGIFVSVETKRLAWQWGGTERETAQLHWINLVRMAGGAAGFARTPDEFAAIIGEVR